MGEEAPNSTMGHFSIEEIHMLVSTAQFPDFDRLLLPGKVGMLRCNLSSSQVTGVADGNTKTKLLGKKGIIEIFPDIKLLHLNAATSPVTGLCFHCALRSVFISRASLLSATQERVRINIHVIQHALSHSSQTVPQQDYKNKASHSKISPMSAFPSSSQ